MAVGPVRWTERWIARAQRKADLRAARFLRHEDRVRAGTEPLSFLERIESRDMRVPHPAPRGDAGLDRLPGLRSYDASLRVADAWLTWVRNGPVRGPDGVRVAIWIRSAGQDTPGRNPPDGHPQLRRPEPQGIPGSYTVCLRRMPAGQAEEIASFTHQTSARWYAVELARQVHQVGITSLRPAGILPAAPVPATRLDEVMTDAVLGVGGVLVHGVLRLPRRARARWRQVRTGRG